MHQHKSPSANNAPLVVSTLHGDVKVKSSKVFVKIGDKFISKPARLLMKGEEILRPKAGMPRITLEMADEGLRNSNNRYVLSQHTLFEQHNGTNYAVFQQALLSGMAQNPEIWPEQIARDAKITASFASGQPIALDCAQKEAAAEFIRGILGAKGVLNPLTGQPISAEHIAHHWLEGTVTAPRHYADIANALLEIAPKMEKLLAQEFHDAYRTYLAIRHKIVEKVNSMFFAEKPEGDKDGNHAHSHNHNGNGHSIHVDEEAAYLANYFASNASPRFCVSRVIGIRKQPKPSNGSAPAQDGLPVVDEIPDMAIAEDRLPLKPKAEIAREYFLLERTIVGLITRFICDKKCDIPQELLKKEATIQKFVFNLKFELTYQLGFREMHLEEVTRRTGNLDSSTRSFLGFYEIGTDRAIARAGKILAAGIRDYSLDTHYGLSKGEILKLFEEENKRRVAIPGEVFYAKVLEDAMFSKQQRYDEQKASFEFGKKYGTEKRTAIPFLSFKTEHRELEILYKNDGIRAMVAQFSRSFTEFDETNALLERIGINGIAQKSQFLYSFAYAPAPKEQSKIEAAVYSR